MLVHVLIFLSSASLNLFSIAAAPVLYQGQWYRLLSSSFTHGGIFHIGMNMMSLMQLGPSLEFKFGTLPYLFMTLWTIVTNGVLYVSISWLAGALSGDESWLVHSGVGYSGVLFTLAMLESYHSAVQSRSVFGFFSVPAKVYPWILLALISLLLPNISFLGHLCGILSGLLFVSGTMEALLPSPAFFLWMEELTCLRWLVHLPAFSRSSDTPFSAPGANDGGIMSIVYMALLYVCYFIETVLGVCGMRIQLSPSFESCWTKGSSFCSGLCASIMGSLQGLVGHAVDGNGAGYTPPWASSSGNGALPYSPVAQRASDMA